VGLGAIAEAPVEIRWRDPDGAPREETFQLKAGWHTIRLGWPADDEKLGRTPIRSQTWTGIPPGISGPLESMNGDLSGPLTESTKVVHQAAGFRRDHR
jgi:hypothetical protein